MNLPKTSIRLPGKNWRWSSDWKISRCKNKYMKDRPSQIVDHDGTYDNEGWQYAIDWGLNFSGTKGMSEFVRRRRWVRNCVSVPDANPYANLAAKSDSAKSDFIMVDEQKSESSRKKSYDSSNQSPRSDASL